MSAPADGLAGVAAAEAESRLVAVCLLPVRAPAGSFAPADATAYRQRRVRSSLTSALRRGGRSSAVELVMIVALAAGLAFGVQAFVVKPFTIPTGSMLPTLVEDEKILVNRLAYSFGSPQLGDVAVFTPPAGADGSRCGVRTAPGEPCPQGTPEPDDENYVKRIVAGPGDTLSVRDGHPVVDGELIEDEPYIKPCLPAGAGCDMPREITIPEDHYFMMGDNRGHSDDSRFWGPVPEGWIIGKAFFTYWPPNEIGGF